MNSYTLAHRAAFDLLLQVGADSLPIKLSEVLRQCEIKPIKDSAAHILKDGEVGICLHQRGQWYIVYDDAMIQERIRFTICHELGHIVLGHDEDRTYGIKNRLTNETEANLFAAEINAPAVVLCGAGIIEPEDIAVATGLSMQAAEIRAKRIRQISTREDFGDSYLDRHIYYQFEDWILANRKGTAYGGTVLYALNDFYA